MKSNDIPPSDSTHIEPEKELENKASPGAEALTDKENEPFADAQDLRPTEEPEKVSKPETAQTPVNEPFGNTQDKPIEKPETSNEQAKPVSVDSKPSITLQLLISARNAIQFRKRKKLDKVMTLFLQ